MGNKTKLQMRTDLATDLKVTIDTEITTDELNRSIDRAYSDLSRFLPDEKIFEGLLEFDVEDETVEFPKDTSTDAIVAGKNISAVEAGDTATVDGQPDIPRPLTVTLTDGSDNITGLTIIVEGIDKDNQVQQETFHYTKGDSKTIVGRKYFKYVTSVEIDQIAGNAGGEVLDIGYGAYTDVWVYLANSPIKSGSETFVGSDDAACTKDTDYYIDYANGRVKAIANGELAAEEKGKIDYTKSQIGIDISDLPDLIRVDRVEYPIGNVPQTFPSYDIFGKYIIVTGGGDYGGQGRMSEDEQYRILYYAKHKMPGEYSPGTEPSFLTDTVMLAASAYALFTLALKYEHQAASGLDGADAALTAVTGSGIHGLALAALNKVATYLEYTGGAYNAAGILANITDNAANLRTAVDQACGQCNSALGKTSSIDLDANDVGAVAWLLEGEQLINEVNVGGQNVAPTFADYARAKISIANARTASASIYVQEAAQRLSNVRSHIEEAGGWNRIAEDFIAEAAGRISELDRYLAEAAQHASTASTNMALADRFRTEAIERRNEAWAIWRDPKSYIGDYSISPVRQTSR